jgi:hypothetical protein
LNDVVASADHEPVAGGVERHAGDLTGIDDLGTERLLKSLWKVSARHALYWWHGSQYYSGSNRRSSRSVYRRIRFRQARPLGGPRGGCKSHPDFQRRKDSAVESSCRYSRDACPGILCQNQPHSMKVGTGPTSRG